MPSDGVRRCAWAISRPDGAVQDGRQIAGHQLFVHGGLRGSRPPLRGDSFIACLPQGLEFFQKNFGYEI